MALAALASGGCGDGAADPDGGPKDAGPEASTADASADAPPTGPLRVGLQAPPRAYLDESTCVRASHDGGPAAELTFVWGDGERETVTGTDEACHAWALPGDMLVSVIVEARGMRADASEVVLVVPRPSDPRPTHSSTIAYDAARDRVWVVNPDAGTVAVLDTEPPALRAEIAVGDRPRTLAVSGDHVLVACQGDGTLWVLDAEDGSVQREISLHPGSGPYGVVPVPGAAVAYVTLMHAEQLAVVRPATGELVEAVDVGPDPRGIAALADGTVLVTRWRSDSEGARVLTLDTTDPLAPTLVGPTLLPRDDGLDSDTDNSGVPSFLGQVVPTPAGFRAIVPALKANVSSGTFRTDTPLTSQTTARGVYSELVIRGPGTVAEERIRRSLDDLDFASAAAFGPDGGRFYLAFQGAQRVLAVDAFDFNVEGSIDEVGIAPQGLAVGPNGERLYVDAFLSRAVRIYDVSDLSREPPLLAEVPTVGEEPLAPEVLRGKRIFYTSRDPRMSRTSYLSCASCHLDGEADGLVWDFTQRGEGLRNTVPLRGRAGTAHGPLHWTGNFDELQDFEHDIRDEQGGGGFLTDEQLETGTRDEPLGDPKAGLDPDLDALAAYVESLSGWGTSPYRRDDDPSWVAAFERGRAIFESDATGCRTCHAGSRFTDSAFDGDGEPVLHDVGTTDAGSGTRLGEELTGLDTPTLRGLWKSAPYLHDGSAATLRQVLTERNPDDAHGSTSHLSDTELDDLVTYLRALDDGV